jgi:hypothetical protein
MSDRLENKLWIGRLTERMGVNTAHDPEYLEIIHTAKRLMKVLLIAHKYDGQEELKITITVSPVDVYELGDREFFNVTVDIPPSTA